MMVNRVVRTYYVAFGDFRVGQRLSPIEEQAYRRIEVAYWRIDQFAGASVKDLSLPEAIAIAHQKMGWKDQPVPNFSTVRRNGTSFRPQSRRWLRNTKEERTGANFRCPASLSSMQAGVDLSKRRPSSELTKPC